MASDDEFRCGVCDEPESKGHADDCPGGEVTRLKAEVERLRAALTKINAIRNSIVGMQGFNFSEHAYPLVAALDEAGFSGMGYENARVNLGTLIEQRDKAEAALVESQDELNRVRGAIANFFAPGPGIATPEYHTYPNGKRNDDEPAAATWNAKLGALHAALNGTTIPGKLIPVTALIESQKREAALREALTAIQPAGGRMSVDGPIGPELFTAPAGTAENRRAALSSPPPPVTGEPTFEDAIRFVKAWNEVGGGNPSLVSGLHAELARLRAAKENDK